MKSQSARVINDQSHLYGKPPPNRLSSNKPSLGFLSSTNIASRNEIYSHENLDITSDEIFYKIVLDVPILPLNLAIVAALCNLVLPGSGTIMATCVGIQPYS